jgi:predicted nucleotidyltransferase component of viral defense system
MPQAQAQTIEVFHLAFLQVLSSRLNQKNYVIKGGANLRYFFDSHRYSEDIDLDAGSEEAWKLKEKVDEVLASAAVNVLLRRTGVSIAETTKSKQTDTTQRWKVQLAVADREKPIATKIEFSRRNGDRRSLLEAVPDRVVAPYALRPPTLQHYTAAPATEQKVKALALRNETQARDVFDLELLFRGYRDAVERGTLESATLDAAMERTLELPFEAFEAQVIPFLEPDVAGLYVDPAAWEQMQSYVVDRLDELK